MINIGLKYILRRSYFLWFVYLPPLLINSSVSRKFRSTISGRSTIIIWLFINSIYIEPNATQTVHKGYVKTIEEITVRNDNDKFVVVGEFKLPNINWTIAEVVLVYTALTSSVW